jgi:hypothetical protein
MAWSTKINDITPEQSKGARAKLGWSAEDLASRALVPVALVRYFERSQLISAEQVAALRFAFEDAGIEFFTEIREIPAVRLKNGDARAHADKVQGMSP